MIVINQIKIPVEESQEKLGKIIAKKLNCSEKVEYKIKSKSIDARDKNQIFYVYSVLVSLDKKEEERLTRKGYNNNIMLTSKKLFQPILSNKRENSPKIVIVGTGPAGLFCGYLLALNGFCPLLIERGMEVTRRSEAVSRFWQGEALNEKGSVQFGEGGAGTFSDGKLNTGNKDKFGYQQFMLETFVKFGAPEEILYSNKPHIGTDCLASIMLHMRHEMEKLGASYQFESQVTDVIYSGDELQGVEINHESILPCSHVVFAMGHSARDTFQMLHEKGLLMERKSFAIGVRIAHPQKRINEAQYGKKYADLLPAADYKMVHKATNGRNVFSFCMCPGGYIVNASSKEGMLAINGMSYQKRDGEYANGAIVASVTPEDFPGEDVLSGVAFQEKWEKAAWEEGNGCIPVQQFVDYKADRIGEKELKLETVVKGQYQSANLRGCLPNYINDAIIEGILGFDKKLSGFGADDAIIAGVETRTSSPVRMLRNEEYESNLSGIYPCGEGAGYAGGITSAAVDGMKVALALMKS